MRRRSGFTLVEVLVAMALILFIMTILAAAFGAATQTVSDLKAAGDLAERLRGAATVLKRDLEAPHCYNSVGAPSPLHAVWDATATPPSPPTWGFFRIYEAQPDALEGQDLDGLPSYYQTTTSLHYTITLGGNQRNDFLSAVVPSGSPLLNPSGTDPVLSLYPPDQRYQDTTNVYNSPTAEVAVFLVPTGDVTDNANGGSKPLYALYRRQLLTTPPLNPQGQTPPPDWVANPPVPSPAPNYLEVSTVPTAGEPSAANLTFNSLVDLSMPIRRFWMDRSGTNPNQPAGVFPTTYQPAGRYATMGESNPGYQAADLLMPDVVSFDVRVLLANDPTNEFHDLFDPAVQAYSNGNPAFYSLANPQGPAVFDTWSSQTDPLTNTTYAGWGAPGTPTSIPLYRNAAGATINIKAIQITLRVWDFKTKKTRQVTIVQQT